MDRRTLLTSIASAGVAGACTAKDSRAAKSGRPALAVDPAGPGRWRIRSWQWRANAWQPLIASAIQSDAGILISGQIDPADRAEVSARLGA